MNIHEFLTFCFVIDETAEPDLEDTVCTTEDPETKEAIDSMEGIDGKFIHPHQQNFGALNIFLSISLNIYFGCSREPSH